MDIVTVTVTAPHFNSYGPDYAKAVGDTYECSTDAAASLVRDGLVQIGTGED